MALFSRTAATRFQLALWERWPAWCTKLATILKFVDCAVWCPGMSLGSGILRMRQQASGAACRQWLHCDAGPMMQPTLTWKNAVAAFDCFRLFGQLHKLGCFCSVHLRTWRSEVRNARPSVAKRQNLKVMYTAAGRLWHKNLPVLPVFVAGRIFPMHSTWPWRPRPDTFRAYAGPMMQPTLTWKSAVAAFDCLVSYTSLGVFAVSTYGPGALKSGMHVLRWQSGKTLRWCTRRQGDCGIKTCPSCPSSSLVGSFRCTQRDPEGPGQIHSGPMPGLWCSLHWLGRVL